MYEYSFRREEQNNFETEHTETAKIVRLETATETIMAYVGYLTNEILAEQSADSRAERAEGSAAFGA